MAANVISPEARTSGLGNVPVKPCIDPPESEGRYRSGAADATATADVASRPAPSALLARVCAFDSKPRPTLPTRWPKPLIELGDWVRPVLLDGLAVLLLEPPRQQDNGSTTWRTAPRAVVKQY